MGIRKIVVCILLLLAAGCHQGAREWVIGTAGVISKRDASQVQLAREGGVKYLNAWIDEDYRSMFSLRSRRTTKDYDAFQRLAIVWRTKGFPQREALTPENKKQIASTLEPLLNITDEQARILLWLVIIDKSGKDEISAKRWPERVLLMKVLIGSHASVLLFGMENGGWKALCDPGMIGPDELKELESLTGPGVIGPDLLGE